MIMEIVSIFLGIILLGAAGYGYGDEFAWHRLQFLVDMPSFVIILVFTVPVLLKGGVWKDFIRAWKLLSKKYTCHLSELRRSLDVVEMMQKQVIYAGVICMLLSLITILGLLSDPASLGPNLAVAILTMLYAVVFEMLLLPLQLEVKRRIIDYMKVDTDEEGEAETANREREKPVAEQEYETAVNGKDGKNTTGEENETAAERKSAVSEAEKAETVSKTGEA